MHRRAPRAHPLLVALTVVSALAALVLGPVDVAQAFTPLPADAAAWSDPGHDHAGHDHAGHDHAAHDHGGGLTLDVAPTSLAAATRAVPVAATLGDTVCAGLRTVDADLGLCTHGEDVAPAALQGASPGDPVPARALTCIDNGRSGQRVQVVYVHTSSSNAPSSSRLSAVQRWVRQVEWTIGASAERRNGERRVRWVTDGDCDADIDTHRVSSASMSDFETMIDELRDDGFTRSDRTYLLFVDSDRYCGIATAPRDDDPTGNRADQTAGYARVDRGCWDTGDDGYHSIAAHELVHTLGGVQQSAPNATPGAHCTDEHDLMCYDDGTGSAPRTVCRDSDSSTSGAGDANDRLLDCNGDDYFHPSPRSGSYLDTHWNVADSARLQGPASSSPKPSQPKPPSPTSDPVGYVLYVLGI